MAEKDKNVRSEKTAKSNPNFIQKIGAFIVRTAKRLKNFFISLKAELKRVIWPDRKRLIQSTATVLAICVLIGVILFVVDSLVGGLLKAVGFYSGGGTANPTTAPTTAATTVATTVATIESDISTTAAETSAAG
ncbi:MAG TPA: preprotein translocase subunit SecE [Clostridiales bacterium]|nr:preprotein translocase subunit SecE [Clostridiales bacterium]